MKPCISQATTLKNPFEADPAVYRGGGWTAVELWLTKLETFLESHSPAEALTLLESAGLTPAAAASQGGLLLSQGTERVVPLGSFPAAAGTLARAGSAHADRHS